MISSRSFMISGLICCWWWCSVTKSCLTLCDPMKCSMPIQIPCPSLYPGVCSGSCLLSWWYYLTISSSASLSPPAFSLPQHQGLSQSQLFTSGSQSIEALASASVLPVNIQGLSTLGLSGLISLQSKGLWRVFSSTTIWKHQFSGTHPSLWSNSHIHTWLLGKP